NARFRTIRFDNRGVGRTGVPRGPYTVETMAADAVAVLDAAGEPSAHVVGASMGGLVAQEVALSYPERVRSLVLACTFPGGADSAPFDADAAQMVVNRASMTPEEAAEAAIPFVYAAGTPRSRIDEDFAVRLAIPTAPEGYRNQMEGSAQWRGAYPPLAGIRGPPAVVPGTDNRTRPPAQAQLLAGAIPGARLEWIEDASHVFFTDQPERTTEVLLDFLPARAAEAT